MKKVLSVVLSIVLIVSILPLGAFNLTASAYSSVDGYYAFTAEYNKATITRVNRSISGDITIPSTLLGFPVVSIDMNAFYGCKSITSIDIPNGVTSIGRQAFCGCTSLESVTIPDSVTSIGYNAFYNCTSLVSINVSSENSNYLSDNGVLFNKDKTELICYPGSKIDTSYVIPNSVTSIGEYAFYNCISLKSITIPNSVTSIGEGAFKNITSLESVTIGNSVESIGDYAFRDCTSLESITIPDSVTSIGYNAFYNCTSLVSINVSSGNSDYSSDSGILFNKDKTELICYPAGKKDTSYVIPNSVTSIGEYAFYNCISLKSITIPNSVTSMGYYAFYCCTSLTSIAIPNRITILDDWTFANCTSLKSVFVPKSLTWVDYHAFYECSEFQNVYYEGSEEEYGEIHVSLYNDYFKNATVYYNSIGLPPGDINDSGEVTLDDVVVLAQIVAGWQNVDHNEAALDVNSDGDTTLDDVVLLAQFVAGWGVILS